MNVNMSGNGGVSAMPTAGQAATLPGKNAVAANAKLFGGTSVRVVTGGGESVPDPTVVLLSMMQSHYQALRRTAENLGVSKEMRELHKRRQKELAEQMRDLKDRKVDYEQARITFINSVDSAEDRALFEKRMAETRPAVMA